MDAEWVLWIAVLVIWPLAGIGMAFLFTEIVHAGEDREDPPFMPKVTYLRRHERPAGPLNAPTQTWIRRVPGPRHRH